MFTWNKLLFKTNSPHRRGATIAELLVAATILTAGITFIAQGTVQAKRLMQDMRFHQLALDELTNQLERLTALSSVERESAITDIRPSKAIQSILTDVSVKAEEIRDEDGTRIQMSIQWLRRNPGKPLVLVGWVRLESTKESSVDPIVEERKPSASSRRQS
jgi:hypothetical protein